MRRFVDLYVQVKLFAKVQRAQAVVVEEAKAACPVGTGELQSSIAAGEIVDDGKRIVGPVLASAPHAAFLEFGTGLRGMGTYPYPLPQENVPYSGSWIYDYRNVGWVGMASQAYLRPALDISRQRVLAEFEK
jgi:hypothetical protein